MTFIKEQPIFGKPITASTGDGANDINMIQSSHIGFGIQGNEGNAAASFSDYAVTKFSDIRRLMFWHGRNFASKAANFMMWFLFKAMLYSAPVFYFNIYCGYSGLTYITDILMALYEVILTTFAIYTYLLLEQDVSFKDSIPSEHASLQHK